jgi:hypothetical protein
MKTPPTSELFVSAVLVPLVARRANGECEQSLRDELLLEVLPWVREQVKQNVRRIPTNADPSNVSSHMHEAAYQAVARLDWLQYETWPMYLGALVRRAAQEAARHDDYLSRQQRVLRKRFRLACIAAETKLQRQLLTSERCAIATDIAEGRQDLIDSLIIGWHPQEFADVPDSYSEQTSIEDSVEQAFAQQRVKYWLDNELPANVRQMVLDWLSLPRSKVLPQRLEKHLQPYVMSLLKAIDGMDSTEIFERLHAQAMPVAV